MLNPFEQYKQMSVSTMTRGELLVLLYDELIKKLVHASVLIDAKKFEDSSICIKKAIDIINYLIVTLDTKYAISKELRDYYNFFNTQLIKANAKNDKKILEDILLLIKELRNTWVEADKVARMNKN